MKRVSQLLVICALYFVGCKSDLKKQTTNDYVDFELIHVRTSPEPEHDLESRLYLKSDDSKSIYVRLFPEDFNTGNQDSIPQFNNLAIDQPFRKALTELTDYLDTLESGPLKERLYEGKIYCGIENIYAFRYKKLSGESKFFSFLETTADSAVSRSLIESKRCIGALLTRKSSNTGIRLNVDSIAKEYNELSGAKELAPPPLRSTIKFTPPEIEPDEKTK